MQKTVLIIGSGFIGLPLAQRLQQHNYHVTVTTTQASKLTELQQQGINALQFDANSANDYAQFAGVAIDYLIYTLPPSACQTIHYTTALSTIVEALQAVNCVVFTSSISVYQNNNEVHTEASTALNNTAITTTEQYIQQQFSNHYMFRLAGLIGATARHPSIFFKKGSIDNSNKPVNLVLGTDVVALITQALLTRIVYGTYNICAPQHYSKKEYYSRYNSLLVCNEGNEGKTVNGNLIATLLAYEYANICI